METLKTDRRVSAFKTTDAYAVEAYRVVSAFPSRAGTGLAEEIRRAAIAAGGAVVAASAYSDGGAEERAFLRRARRALFESRYYLHLARRFGWLDARRYRALTLRQDAAVRELDAVIDDRGPRHGGGCPD
jgi:four helix bundle protein